MSDRLDEILARKARETARRARWATRLPGDRGEDRSPLAIAALRRGDRSIRVIAEIKRSSPSAGQIRARAVGDTEAIARGYERAGASVISVLADRAGFGGGVLDVRRAARAVSCPILFKEFVIDPAQLAFARAAGASLVLLLLRALEDRALARMIAAVRDRGMEPLLEAADREELVRALATDAAIVGVNARDLRSFTLDPSSAAELIQEVPNGRVAVYMSGVGDPDRLAAIARGRADAVLIGTELMRAPDPGARLRDLLEAAGRR